MSNIVDLKKYIKRNGNASVVFRYGGYKFRGVAYDFNVDQDSELKLVVD